MVKYRLNFVMPAEVLFGLLAKVLPIEDLSVEEIAPTPAKFKVAQHLADNGPSHAPQLVKPRKGHRRSRESYTINLKAGVNGVLLDILSDGGTHPTAEFKPAMAKRGYAAAGTSSALEKLRKRGLIYQPEAGVWRLVEQKQSA